MKYQLINRKKKYRFKVYEDEVYQSTIKPTHEIDTSYIHLSMDGEITAKKGYAWDGSSIPFKDTIRFLSFKKLDLDKYCKTASLIHDAFYQLIQAGELPSRWKSWADMIYERLCIIGGMKRKAASIRYNFVRKFGNAKIKNKNIESKVYEV